MADTWQPVSHLVDDYEKVCTAAIRSLDRSIPLLMDAQHALEHGRTTVTAEFLERAVTDLTDALAALRARLEVPV